MTANLPEYVGCFLLGAACVGAWWWWINHKAKARALLKTAEQAMQGIGGKKP